MLKAGRLLNEILDKNKQFIIPTLLYFYNHGLAKNRIKTLLI